MLRLAVLALALPLVPTAGAQPTVLHNARIYTVSEARPTAQALAFNDGLLLAVGSDAEVLAAYPDAQRLDAGGQTVVPGLIDAHAHLMGLGTSLLQVDLVGTTSVEDIVSRLEDFAADLPAGAWVTGRGWGPKRLARRCRRHLPVSNGLRPRRRVPRPPRVDSPGRRPRRLGEYGGTGTG